MRTLDRYFIREVLTPFSLTLLVFTFILVIPPIMDYAEQLIAKGVPPGDILRIVITLLPQALGITIPMALLVGLLIALGKLSGDSEIVAMQACGISSYSLLRPVLMLSTAAAAATAWVMIVAIPDANQRFREITYGIVATRAEHDVKPRVFFEDFPSRVLYVRDVPGAGGWRDVFLADSSRTQTPEIFLARAGRIVLDPEAKLVQMTLEDGLRHTAGAGGPQEYDVLRFRSISFHLDPATVFPRTGLARGYSEMDIAALRKEIAIGVKQGLSPHNPIMAIHRKFSIPVACFALSLMGLALGMTSTREGKLASFVLGIGVIFFYYVVMYTAEGMAKGHMIPAALAPWLPNIIVGGVGLILLVRRSGLGETRFMERIRAWRRKGVPADTNGEEVVTAALSGRRPKRVVLVLKVPHGWIPTLRMLDRYLMRLYMRIFALSFLAMLTVFNIATFIDLSDKLFKGTASGGLIARYHWYSTPQTIYFVLPLAALIAALVSLGLLTKSSELIVMRACGISLYRTSVPLLFLGAMWSGVLFALEETILAQANHRAAEVKHVIRTGSPRTFNVLNRRWIVSRDGNSIYHYSFYEPDRKQLSGLSIYELDPKGWTVLRRTSATLATYRHGAWEAEKGWVRDFRLKDAKSYQTFERGALRLEEPEYFGTEQPDAERMTYRELKGHIEELRASGFNVVPHIVALYRKLSFPFVTVVMTLIAIPFAITTGRRGALYGIGTALVLALIYWVMLSIFAAIGSAGMLPPALAAWAPNIMMLAAAAYLLLSART